MVKMKKLNLSVFFLFVIFLFATNSEIFAQLTIEGAGGGYIARKEDKVVSPDIQLINKKKGFYINPNVQNIKAIGMGKTQIANGYNFNAMLDNPALLSRKRVSFDLLTLQVGIPKSSFSAISYINDNAKKLENGNYFNALDLAYQEYEKAETADEQFAAIGKMNEALSFPREFKNEILGTEDNPKNHNLNFTPSFQLQIKNFGFSYHAQMSLGFEGNPGQTVERALNLKLPVDSSTVSAPVLKEILEIVNTAIDGNGNITPEASPEVFAFSYIDQVLTFGYAHTIEEGITIGANLKHLKRRFTTKNFDLENLDTVFDEFAEDFGKPITAITLDLGGLYYHKEWDTEFGISIQNIIPVKKTKSTANFSFIDSESDYVLDENGEKLVGFVDFNGDFYSEEEVQSIPGFENVVGDTLISVIQNKVTEQTAFELRAPLLVNLGSFHKINENWDVSFDFVDLFARNENFENYFERFRIGTEYRTLKNILAFRTGIADNTLTFGAGLSFKIIQFDLAFAHDNFANENVWLGQLKFGW